MTDPELTRLFATIDRLTEERDEYRKQADDYAAVIVGHEKRIDALAKTAELRDELWAAAKAYHASRAAYDNQDDPELWEKFAAAWRANENTLFDVCRKIAETET